MGTFSGPGSGLGAAAQYLDGQFLIAMPSMGDDRFARSVIYMCAHSSDGAMGIVLNQAAPNVTFPDLLVQLEIVPDYDRDRVAGASAGMTVRQGGPVEPTRGFVLHTSDYTLDHATLPIDEALSLTTTLEILRAIAEGRGPAKAILALGYAGWGPGQLESEIQANGWLHCPSDMETIFGCELDEMYDRVLRKLGVDLVNLSSSAGHA